MGCLTGSVSRVSEGLQMSVKRIGEDIMLSANRASEGLRMDVERIGDSLALSAHRVSEGLRMSISIICSVEDSYYLEVSPEFVWLTPDNDFSANFEVVSNTDWEIIKE